jgi:hypothetical protein
MSVRITPEGQLKMIEKPDNIFLVGKNCEQVHFKSQSKFKEDASSDGNTIYLSRIMHEHFDGINAEDKNIPSFKIRYVGHSDSKESIIVNGQEFLKCRVVVDVCFRPLDKFLVLTNVLKDGCEKLNNFTYRMNLYFDDGREAKDFINFKEIETEQTWTKFNQIEATNLMLGVEDV